MCMLCFVLFVSKLALVVSRVTRDYGSLPVRNLFINICVQKLGQAADRPTLFISV